MVRVISQETFNDAVQENVDVLGISFEEALQETIKQFEAQSVDLSNISKQIVGESIDESPVIDAIKTLQENKNNKDKQVDALNVLKEYCEKGIEYKILAGKKGAYSEILSLISESEDVNLQIASLKTMLTLMSKQPDLLDDKGVAAVLKNLDLEKNPELAKLSLKWAKECCVMHEMNRQKFYDANILKKAKVLLEQGESDVLRDVLILFRALVLDDDVRVEFGKAHEHARGIAAETLSILTNLMIKFKSDENVVNDLILTISSLLVRNEFCKQVAEEKGLDQIKEIMTEYEQNERINKQCFKLLKALAGNDDCKAQIITKGLGPLITTSLSENTKSVPVATAGLACVAALCLRCPQNSKVLFESGIPEVIIQIMKDYPKEKAIQKSGSWAIRNMVSRSKSQCSRFLDLGVEEILKNSLKTFKECEYDIKAALRDLDCEVELKEEWTGKGGLLNHFRN